jgi:enoyl-CoA hydratase
MNALNLALVRELKDAMQDVVSNKAVRVLVFTGKGKAFCAGADLKMVDEEYDDSGEVEKTFLNTSNEAFGYVENCTKPIIAAVNGFALAGGFEIYLWSDLVIASEDAKIGDAHANYMLFGPISVNLLPRQIGFKKTMELMLTGDMWPAAELEKIGLVNKVVARETLLEEAKTWAKKLASKPRVALSLLKNTIDNGMNMDLQTAITYEGDCFVVTYVSDDGREGFRAFIEKRKPDFTDK